MAIKIVYMLSLHQQRTRDAYAWSYVYIECWNGTFVTFAANKPTNQRSAHTQHVNKKHYLLNYLLLLRLADLPSYDNESCALVNLCSNSSLLIAIVFLFFLFVSVQDVGGSAKRKELAAGHESLRCTVQVSNYSAHGRLSASYYRWPKM